jgi:hypothetical protein
MCNIKYTFILFLLVTIGITSCHKGSSPGSNTVTTGPVPDFDILISGNLKVGQPLDFGTTLSQNSNYTYYWDWGIGTDHSAGDLLLVLKLSKTYTITCIVNNDTSHKKSKSFFINPDYSFSWAGVPLPGDSVSFPLTYGILAGCSYLWHFGDGSSSTDSFPYHRYADTGSYQVSLVINNDTANIALGSVRIFKDPLYTSLAQGTKLWHRTETQFYLNQTNYYTFTDTASAVGYLNPVTISVWGTSLLYNPDSSSGNTLYFGSGNLNLTYNHIANTSQINYNWVNYFPEYTGPGHHPWAYNYDVWTSP